MNWTTPKNKKTIKRRVVIHHDKELLKSAVINNLVPEDKREILFNTQISDDDSIGDVPAVNRSNEEIARLEDRIGKLEVIVKKLVEYLVKESQQQDPCEFETPSTGSLRRGMISVPSISSGNVSTPCLLIRTSRFLAPHLTPDNLDQTIPADSSILEMNFDFILENEAILKNSPLSIGELAGFSGKRATCLTTRVHCASEQKAANVINGDDFVTVQNASGSNKFDLKGLESILQRFKPDFFIGAFDEHLIPVSLKRVRKAVDRNLKYEKFSETASEKLNNIPFLSSISGAEYLTEKERNVSGISQKSSGLAFCDIQKLSTVEERLNLVKGVCSVEGRDGLCRIIRGSISPTEMVEFLPFADMFDTSFVDEITAKGHVLNLNYVNTSVEDSLDLWDEKYFEDFTPLTEGCSCHACKNYARSYVHHLLKSHEMLAGVLLMMHNLHQYYLWLEHLKTKL